MPVTRRRSRKNESFEVAGLDDLGTLTPTDHDLLREGAQQLRPLLKEFSKPLLKAIAVGAFTPPPDKVWKRIQRQLPDQFGGLRTQLSRLKGERLTDEEFEKLLSLGVANARTATDRMMQSWDGAAQLTDRNLVADGTYQISGSSFAYFSPGTSGDLVLNLSDSKDLTTAEIILITSIVVEVLGFVFALFGVIFPRVDLVKLWNKVFRTRSRTVFRQMQRLLEILMDAQKTVAQKLEAILKFVNALANLGVLSDIVAQIFHDLSWWRIGLLIVQFLAQLALWLIPGAQAALAAQKAIAMANAVVSLTTKARDLGDMLTRKA